MNTFKQFLTENKLEFKDDYDAYNYAMKQKKRITEVEEYLLRNKDGEEEYGPGYTWILAYCTAIMKTRWDKFEKILLKESDIDILWDYACDYLQDIVKGRWIELEERLIENFSILEKYCEMFNVDSFQIQEEVIQRNPAIIGKIEYLFPALQKKFKHLINYYASGISKT